MTKFINLLPYALIVSTMAVGTYQIYIAPRDKLSNFYLAICTISTLLMSYYFSLELLKLFK